MAFAKCSGCLTNALDLFKEPLVELGIERSRNVMFHPISSLEESNIIEFVVSGTDQYIDLSALLLEVQVKIVKVDVTTGKDVDLKDPEDKLVCPEQLLLHSLFSQVDLIIGDRIVTPSLGTYPYRSFLETLLSYSSDAKNSFLTAEGWVGGLPASNTIDVKRSELSKGSRVISLCGRPHLDLCHQPLLLPPHLDIRLRLLKSKDAFCIMHTGTGAAKIDPRIRLLEVNLFVRQVDVSPEVAAAHLKAQHKAPIVIPIRRALVRQYPFAASSTLGLIDNILGQIPVLMVLGLVKSNAVNGKLDASPFAFSHFNVNRVTCFVDGQPHPVHPYTPDFAQGKYARSYLSLFQATGNYLSNDGIPPISYADYPNMCLWGISLAPDTDHSVQRSGTIRIEFNFSVPTVDSVSCILFMEHQNTIHVTYQREVITDF